MKIGDPIEGDLNHMYDNVKTIDYIKYSFKKDLSERISDTLYFGIDKIDLLEVVFSELSIKW